MRLKIAILFAARALGVFALSRHLTHSRLRILCYHGGVIGDESEYNPKLFCSTETFRDRVLRLKRLGFDFVSLDDAISQHNACEGRLPLRATLTFDDGWYSTTSGLLPVLAKMQIPSTLYLSTKNFLEGWPILSVTVRYIIWKAGERSIMVEGMGSQLDGNYNLQKAEERSRLAQHAIDAISARASVRDEVCAELERFAGCLGVSAEELQLESRRFDYMTSQEVLAAAAQRCSIELHGHVHKYPRGNPSQLTEDLRQCEETIIGMGLAKPKHYCYPSGAFDDGATKALDSLGIRTAVTCNAGLADISDSKQMHFLPRFLDGENVHPVEFDAEVSGFSEMMRSCRRRLKLALSGFIRVPEEEGFIHVDG